MCIICISRKGTPQPTESQIRAMFTRNPHGAGFMVATGQHVEIHKGYMNVSDLLQDTRNFTSDDAVVWHFRISTQAGITPEMTQPFPLLSALGYMEELDVACDIGVAHNGIIPMTSTGSTRYSDTALFVSRYMPRLIRYQKDLRDPATLEILKELTRSKLAIMDKSGYVAVVGGFLREKNGLLFSNGSYQSTFQPVKYSGTHALMTSDFPRKQV